MKGIRENASLHRSTINVHIECVFQSSGVDDIRDARRKALEVRSPKIDSFYSNVGVGYAEVARGFHAHQQERGVRVIGTRRGVIDATTVLNVVAKEIEVGYLVISGVGGRRRNVYCRNRG